MQEPEIVTQRRLQKHMGLALGTIPRTVIFYSLFRMQFIAAFSFFFCVCVLGNLFEAFTNLTEGMD